MSEKDGTVISSAKSNVVINNTGAPQGYVCSPILFTTYTNDCQLPDSNSNFLLKFADDSSIQGLIKSDENEYRDTIQWFVKWCEDHFSLECQEDKGNDY